MKLKKILEELKNYIIQITFDDFMHVFIAFPKDWDMTSFFDDNEVYILENSKKTFEENNKIYTIYEFILKSNDFVDDLFNIIIQIKNTFLEKEKMLFELNKKVEQEKLDLERIVNQLRIDGEDPNPNAAVWKCAQQALLQRIKNQILDNTKGNV